MAHIPHEAGSAGRLAQRRRPWSNCRIIPIRVLRGGGRAPQAIRLLLVGALAWLAAVGAWAGAPAGASAAGPSGPCGPAGQPCTWNFSADSSSTHGANVYAGQGLGREGAGVLVAVLDTWVDYSHPDFTGRVVDEADCIGGSCKDHSFAKDTCTHGTHVAGTVASASFGVAPDADILAVQVLNDGGTPGGQCGGSTTDVANGIDFAVAHHARVINLSIGELVPGVLQDAGVTAAVHNAAAAGVVVVVAAGNTSSPGVTDSYGTDALLVAATGPDGQLAGYSNSGGSVSIAAPGGDDGSILVGVNPCSGSSGPAECILSTLPSAAYGLDEGTSMAAPHVAGAAVLLFAENPSRSRADVLHALEATAHPLAGAGSGLLDVGKALALEPPQVVAHSGSAGSSSRPTSSGAAPSANAFAASLPASSGAAPQIAASTTTTTPVTPQTVPTVAPNEPSRRVAVAAPSRSSGGTSVALPGAFAAALLLAAGAGAGIAGRRRLA